MGRFLHGLKFLTPLGKYPRSVTAGSCGKSVFTFVRNQGTTKLSCEAAAPFSISTSDERKFSLLPTWSAASGVLGVLDSGPLRQACGGVSSSFYFVIS